MSLQYKSPHLAWLACLFAVLHQVRMDGLMSIEGEIEEPDDPNALFVAFPQVHQEPYLGFATDVLRMMVDGNIDADEMKVYADHAIHGLLADNRMFSGGTDETLLRTIWLSLWAAMKGYAPRMAVEFGRQAIPIKMKPTFIELENVIKEVRDARRNKKPGAERDIDRFADDFVASLDSFEEIEASLRETLGNKSC